MKTTTKLQALLDRWNTIVRESPSVVTHLVKGTKTEISPLVFAVYETCIKAVYACNLATPPLAFANCTWEEHLAQVEQHYRAIAEKDGFSLPEVTPATDPARCHQDYLYCVKLIQNEGLYYRLLD